MNYKAETFDKWQYLCGLSHDYAPVIRCAIDLDGAVDEALLKRAIMMSLPAAPMIGCGFDGDSRKPRWIDRSFNGDDFVGVVAAGGPNACPGGRAKILTDARPGANVFMEKTAAPGFYDVIDIGSGPQMKITIVKGGAGDSLDMVINHMVCDGAGARQIICLVADMYSQLAKGVTPNPPPFKKRGIGPVFAGLSLLGKVRLLRAGAGGGDGAEARAQCGIDFNTGEKEVYMMRRSFSKAVFHNFKACLKAKGATVNDGMMALLARAFCKNTGTDKIFLPCSMDLRKFIPQDRKFGISNFSGNCVCEIRVPPEDSFFDTVARVSGRMNTFKTGNAVLKQILIFDLMSRFMTFRKLREYFFEHIQLPVLFYSNTGALDTEAIKFGSLRVTDMHLAAPIKPRPYLQFAVSSYEGRFTISCNLYGSNGDRQFVEKLFDDILKEAATYE
jgi:NRPS condensation-like uncharacterized protein